MPEKTRKQQISEQLFHNGLLGNPDMDATNALIAELRDIEEAERLASAGQK